MNAYRLTALIALLILLSGCALPAAVSDTQQFRLIKEKAHAGDAESQYRLGLLYTVTSRRPWDRALGYRWFVAAAEKGHADAQYMAGMGKLLGRGTSIDEEGAVEMFRRSARLGQERAQYQLGLAYLDGRSVIKDRSWGRQWIEQAAWNGHSEAQFMLGALFAQGVGGQDNLAEAWRWLEKARLSGQGQSAAALDRLKERMSQSELDTAKSMLVQQARIDDDGLYANPRLRYVQTMLNRAGFRAGQEDGLPGPRTDAAISSFIRANKLPREAQTMQLIESLRGTY